MAVGVAMAVGGAAALPSAALASHTQVSMIEDFGDLSNPVGTLQTFRELGANTVRVLLPWSAIAPDPNSTRAPSGFTASNPNDYPAANWGPYDNIVRLASEYGMNVDLTVTGGAPRWAEAQAAPKSSGVEIAAVAWEPNAADYGQFFKAVATRYDGHFTPAGQSSALPAVHFWAIFNEPNFGQDLGPQATKGSSVATAPDMYRQLLDQGWNALQHTGHGHDTIVFGELAAEGSEPTPPHRNAPQGNPGDYGQTRPLLFLRDLYCVNSSYDELRGNAAKAIGCPTTAAASRKFRSENPALFSATGFADHPYDYTSGTPVSTAGNQVDYATFQDFPTLERTLDRLNSVYGSGKKLSIYNTEYGYITNPPRGRGYPSPATAAYYINWAEYLSWKQSRVASYMQYLLKDPPANAGAYNGFASGLEYSNGKPKATFAAYMLPLYMPHTSFSRTTSEEVWGDARPAPFMTLDGNGAQKVAIQLNDKTIDTVAITSKQGYFDVHVKFPASGTVRLAYTFPKQDPFLPVTELGKTVYSRSFKVSVR